MPTAKLHDDWTEFLRLLNAHRVRFVIVGAHAVAAHGRPRLTADLDILAEPTLANARRVARAVEQFGFGSLEPEALTKPDTVVFMGREPFRIDVLTSIDGVSFARAWSGRLRAELGGVRVSFLGRRELIANKRAAGRPKDLSDLALLAEGAFASSGGAKRAPSKKRVTRKRKA
jgi:predicted nucleotidyltransferase